MSEDKPAVKIKIPYKPRPYQRILHEKLKRFNVIICHRRFGKTVFAINELIQKALTNHKKRPQYAYIAPQLGQGISIAWEYFKEHVAGIPETKINESRKEIRLPNGAMIKIVGAQNPDALRGTYWDGAIIDEVGDMSPDMWESTMRPALSDRGGWCIFIGTPKGQDYLYDLFTKAPEKKGWYREFITVNDSGVFPLTDEEAEEWKAKTGESYDSIESIKQDMPPQIFEREYMCSFEAGNIGAYYMEHLTALKNQGRMQDVSWDPAKPVITAWDLGINDKTCIWFVQQHDNEIHIMDYYENHGQPLAHYAQHVAGKPYTYSTHILPHDVKARSDITGKTRLDHLKNLGIRAEVCPRIAVQEGIAAVQAILPRCHFDATKAELGIKALGQYRSQYDRERNVYNNVPLHDWSSHAADAFRYLAVGMRQIRNGLWSNNIRTMGRQVREQYLEVNDYDPFDG